MTERPILFSAPMVRAILENRKTQTRRIVSDKARIGYPHHEIEKADEVSFTAGSLSFTWDCPYGAPGDHLWVREVFGIHDGDYGTVLRWRADQASVWVGARGPHGESEDFILGGPVEDPPVIRRWKPSIHMPRWASRITLEVTGVRVERLRDISEADAKAEGCEDLTMDQEAIDALANDLTEANALALALGPGTFTAKCEFMDLWQSINGADSWANNPWVWVVEFRRLETIQ